MLKLRNFRFKQVQTMAVVPGRNDAVLGEGR